MNSDFNSYYASHFKERWNDLREALLSEVKYKELRTGLKQSYFLDEGSFLVASALNIGLEDSVLDMCAAPGGKSLVLVRGLGSKGFLCANELSRQRRWRLKNTFLSHLPEDLQKLVKVTGRDASTWGLSNKSCFDKILLDVPCSSERHVLNSPSHLQKWKPARPKFLAQRQFAMLASALEVVRPGGIIVYSTCALLPVENDEVVRKLYKKRSGRFEIIKDKQSPGQETEFGWHFLPDTCQGMGPSFYSKIKRIS